MQQRWIAGVGLALSPLLLVPATIGEASGTGPVGPPVCASCATPVPAPVAVTGGARLTLTTVPMYQFAIVGTHWAPKRKLTLTVNAGGSTGHLVLRTTSHGVFEVGFTHVNLCDQVTAQIVQSATLRGSLVKPALSCPVQKSDGQAAPATVVIKGKQLKS